MESCQNRLVSWNKLEFGHVGRKILKLQKRLQWLELQNGDTVNGEIEEVRCALKWVVGYRISNVESMV